MQTVLDQTRTPTRQWDYDLKLEAATRAERAFAAVREHRGYEGASLDLVNDPAGTGLIGPEISLITNAAGDLDAKLTSLNPNFAAVLVQYFRQAGLDPGDPVAVAVSGSFPGMNICLFAALETMELRPVVVTSVGASNWGANSPEFTWLDMETLFFEKGIFHTRSQAATFGGGNDMGRGMSPAGRRLLRQSIERNEITFLGSDNIEDAIDKRMALYQDLSQGRAYRLFVNVGGGVASVGNRHNKTLLPEGLSFNLKAHNWPRKGTMILFADKGVPVVHLLRIINLARTHGLPLAPDYQPQPGQGEIFVREMYRWPLAAAFLVVYCLACILILAPEIRRGLFDRLGRRSAVTPVVFLVAAGFLFTPTVSASAQWSKMTPSREGPEICLTSEGQNFTYLVLDAGDPVEFQVNGPRRIKLITRYAFGTGDPESQPFVISPLSFRSAWMEPRSCARVSPPRPTKMLCFARGRVWCHRCAGPMSTSPKEPISCRSRGRHPVTEMSLAGCSGKTNARPAEPFRTPRRVTPSWLPCNLKAARRVPTTGSRPTPR